MHKLHSLGISTVVLTGIFVVILLFWLPTYQEPITTFTLQHPLLAPLILIAWRFLGVVIPPIPAGIFAFSLISTLGWFWVYLYSSIGLLWGACVAFLLARAFREPLVKRFFPLQDINRWESKLSTSAELWGFLLIRLTTGPVMDFISYLAGLTKLRFRTFFLATVVSLLPSALAYYLGAKVYTKVSTEKPWITLALLLGIVVLYFLFKDKIKTFAKTRVKKD